MEAYWIKKCGGYENYTKAPIFHQQQQGISRARKMSVAAKRKAEFAAAQTEEKQNCKKKKAPMTAEVRVIVCAF